MIHLKIRDEQKRKDALFIPRKGMWGKARVCDPVPKITEDEFMELWIDLFKETKGK